jgi:hypothetical protein
MVQVSDLESLFERMVGQKIDSVGIDNDEFVMYIEDGTRIILFSDEDLQLYYELPDATH